MFVCYFKGLGYNTSMSQATIEASTVGLGHLLKTLETKGAKALKTSQGKPDSRSQDGHGERRSPCLLRTISHLLNYLRAFVSLLIHLLCKPPSHPYPHTHTQTHFFPSDGAHQVPSLLFPSHPSLEPHPVSILSASALTNPWTKDRKQQQQQ